MKIKNLTKYCKRVLCMGLVALLSACATDDIEHHNASSADVNPQELQGIQAVIEGNNSATRAGTVTTLADYVGRSDFKGSDRIVFTEIRRSTTPFEAYTYPGKGVFSNGAYHPYEGIAFVAGAEGGWKRATDDGGPERVYWTDAQNDHTFIGYSIPQGYGTKWKQYEFTQGTGDDAVNKTYYLGALGDPMVTGEGEIIDYSLTETELEKEDVLITYDTEMKAEPGGSVALVKFHHALSSVRVVVNISGFSSSSTAEDNKAVVSDLRLLHQPTMYVWMQADETTQPLRASREGASVTDQAMVNSAWANGGSNLPAFDQRKDMKLWIPQPAGVGDKQSRTFTFYGITTPQPQAYISTLGDTDDNRKAEISFKVTYPDPLKPSVNVTNNYTASINDVYFEAGYNTTINITLNHRDEKMTVGAEYENWQFVATPDQGELHKHTTFLESTLQTGVTIVGDPKATADDATWLYESGGVVYDIYGHDGNSAENAYQIRTADQLLSFAYEVKGGRDFTGKYIRLDADLTLQKSSDLTKQEIVYSEDTKSAYESAEDAIQWIGIGDAEHAFNGTFAGGDRFINRLYGKPLFAKLGPDAKLGHMTVSALVVGVPKTGDPEVKAIDGGGLFAETNAGLICGCYIPSDVSLSGADAGAFVGTNTGIIFASHHIGNTIGTTNVGGLAGSNSGVIGSCYQAGTVTGGSSNNGGITPTNSGGTLDNNYYLAASSDATPGATARTAADMTKNQFVTDLNNGISLWRDGDETHEAHSDYHAHKYEYQPATYPKLSETLSE